MSTALFSPQESIQNRKAVLGTILGIAVLVYEFGDRPNVDTPLTAILAFISFVFATLLILRPQRNLFWAGTAAGLTAQIVSVIPMINNHSTLFAALGVALLVSLASNRFSPKGDIQNWFARSEPFLRLVFLMGYGSAAIAKLNAGFFDSTVSCANSMAKEVYAWFPLILPIFDWTVLPYIVAAAELFVFVGLIFKVTRPWAISIAVLFHFALSLNLSSAALAFNPALFATLPLFLTQKATDNLVVVGRTIQNRITRHLRSFQIGVVAFIVIAYAFFFLVPLSNLQYYSRFLITTIFSLTMIAILIGSSLGWRKESLSDRLTKVPGILAWVTVAVLALNSASPYLGGKTGSTFTMYSNLKVEGGVSNHFLIPRLPIKTQQDDLVEIKYSSHQKLMSFKENGEKVNWLVLQQLAKKLPDASVSYVRDGKTYQVAHMGEDPALMNMDPIAGNLFWYRYVPDDGRCEW